ncbi:MAG: GAP family protein [Acidimicrobiia bacterium]|nr:MAG: GAP family protein [Acidimicrobiia bacterium]
MGDVVSEILFLAVGVAVSPVPIAAVIVILFTPKAKTNGPAFLAAWVIGLLFVGFVVLLIPGLQASNGEPSTTTGVIKGLLGVLLLVVGWVAWRKRPGPNETAEAPKWIATIDGFGIGKSFGMGFLLSAVNPKNLLLVAAAAATISAAGLSASEETVALLVFSLIAASTIAVPVVGYLIVGERADETLANAKDWLIQNNSVVMAVLLLVFGVSLVGDALQILI